MLLAMAPPRRKYDIKFKLAVIKFTEQNSGEATARHFGIDPKRVREWRSQKVELQRLSEVDQKRARLQGGGRKKTLKLKREAAIKAEKTMSKSTHEEEEDDEEDEHLPKTGMSKQDPNTSEVAMTEDGAAEQFEFQYGLEGQTFQNRECSKSHLSIIKVEQLDPLLPEQNNSSCGSGSPGDPGPPGSSGFGSSMSPAAQFFRKCHQAGCTQLIFSEFASHLNTITERILSQQASEEDFNLTLKVLEASGMLPEIFANRDQEMEKRLKDLQRETEAVRTARSAMRDACVMSFTPS